MGKFLDGQDYLFLGLGAGALYLIYKLTKPVTDATDSLSGVVQTASGVVSDGISGATSLFKSSPVAQNGDAYRIAAGLIQTTLPTGNLFNIASLARQVYSSASTSVFPQANILNTSANNAVVNNALFGTAATTSTQAALNPILVSANNAAVQSLLKTQPTGATKTTTAIPQKYTVTPVTKSFFDKPIKYVAGKGNTRNY